MSRSTSNRSGLASFFSATGGFFGPGWSAPGAADGTASPSARMANTPKHEGRIVQVPFHGKTRGFSPRPRNRATDLSGGQVITAALGVPKKGGGLTAPVIT